MGRVLRTFLVTLLVLGLVVAVALGALVFGGPGLARNLVEAYVSNLTGRELVIEGSFEPVWGRRLDVTAENLRLANADWAADEQMLTISRLHVVLDLWTLVNRPLLLDAIEIDAARLKLEKHDTHGDNWDIFPPGDSDAPGLDLVIRQIRVDESTIRYEAPNFDRSLVINIGDLDQDLNAAGLLDTHLKGDINELPLEFSGELGPFDNLLAGTNIKFAVEGRLRNSVLLAQGEIDNLVNPRQPRLDLSLRSPDGGELTELLGLGRLAEGDFELTASLTPDGGTNLLRINGQQGRLTIDIDGSIRDIPKLDGISLDADIAGPYLGHVLRLFDLEGPDDPFTIQTDLLRDGSILRVDAARLTVADAVFDLAGELTAFPTLDDAQVSLQINGSDIDKFRELLQLPGLATGPFAITATLDVGPDGVERFQLRGQSDLGRINADGYLGDPATLIGTSVRYDLEGDSLKKLGDAGGIPNLPAEFFSMSSLLEFEEPDQIEWRDFVLTVGEDRLEAGGSASLGDSFAGTDLQISISGNDLAQMAVMVGEIEGVPNTPYNIQGRLRVYENTFRLDNVAGKIAQVDLDAAGVIARPDPWAGSKFDVDVRGPDLRAAVELPDVREFIPPEPFDIQGRMELVRDGLRYEVEQATIAGRSFASEGFLGTALLGAEPDLPLTSTGGRFELELRGPDAGVLPAIKGFAPDPLPFAIAALGHWRQGSWDIEAFMVRLGDAEARIDGAVTGLPDAPAGDIEFNARVPSLARLGTLDERRPMDQPLELFAEVVGNAGQIESRALTARLGQSDINGQIRYRSGEIPELDIDLYSNHFYPPRLFPPENGVPTEEPEPAQQRNDRLIPDTPLPLEDLRNLNVNVDFNFEAAELELRRVLWKNLQVAATIEDGALRVRKAEVEAVAGTLAGSLELVPVGDSANLSLEFQITDMNTGLLTSDAQELALLPKISAQGKLTSTGKDLREVAANLTGDGWLTSTDGRVGNGAVARLFTGDFITEFLNILNPFSRTQPYTEIVCIAMPFVVRQGDVATNPVFAIQTARLNVVSRGDINLRNERLNLGFRNQARRGLGISASQLINPFVRIGGTLSAPRMTVDPQGTLLQGGATVATGGLWILGRGLVSSLFRARDPCGRTMQQHEERLEKAARKKRQGTGTNMGRPDTRLAAPMR